MKRFLPVLLAFLLLTCSAAAEYWTEATDRPVACCDDSPECQVLQTVMMGSFAKLDPQDSLNVRVLSAVLPRLTAVNEDDFAHFIESFDVEPETLMEFYYTALANCLRADMIVTPIADTMDEQNARTVLSLFLSGSDSQSDEAMREVIRAGMDKETLKTIAESADVPSAFAEYLLWGEMPDIRPDRSRPQK